MLDVGFHLLMGRPDFSNIYKYINYVTFPSAEAPSHVEIHRYSICHKCMINNIRLKLQ